MSRQNKHKSKPGGNKQNSTTNGLLQQELEKVKMILEEQEKQIASYKAELEQTRVEIKALQSKLTEMEIELKQAQEIKKENQDLKNILGSVKTQSSREVEVARRELRESERQRQHLEKEIRELKAKLADYEKREPLQTSKQEYTKITEVHEKAAGSMHPPQNVSKKCIAEKIKEWSSKVDPPKQAALHEIRLEQLDRFIEMGKSLRARLPFNIHTRLLLPTTPVDTLLTNTLTDYQIKVVTKRVTTAERVQSMAIVSEVTNGKRQYDDVIPMPKLAPGKYALSIFAVVPFSGISEQKSLEVVVADH